MQIFNYKIQRLTAGRISSDDGSGRVGHRPMIDYYHLKQIFHSFSFFSLAESSPRDLQITAYK